MNGGRTWARRYDCYCRAAWLDPHDPQHLILSPAYEVDNNGRIEESDDGGQTRRPASAGLSVPWRDHLVERFTQVEDDLLAVLSNGELWTAPLASLAWLAALASGQRCGCRRAGCNCPIWQHKSGGPCDAPDLA